MSDAYTGECGYSIADCWRDQWRRHLARSGRVIVGLDQLDVNFRYVAIAHDNVIIEVGFLNLAIFDCDALSQCQAEAGDHTAFGLSQDIVRLDGDAVIGCDPEL